MFHSTGCRRQHLLVMGVVPRFLHAGRRFRTRCGRRAPRGMVNGKASRSMELSRPVDGCRLMREPPIPTLSAKASPLAGATGRFPAHDATCGRPGMRLGDRDDGADATGLANVLLLPTGHWQEATGFRGALRSVREPRLRTVTLHTVSPPCRHRVATVSPPDCAEIGSVRCQVWGSPRFRASARVQVGGVDFRRRRVETPVEGADAVAELPETTGATDVFDLPVLIRRNTLAGQVSPKPPGWSGQEHAHAHGRGGQVGGNPAHATADGTDAGLPFADVHQPVSRWGAGTARPARQDARRGLWPYTADALFTARHSGTGPQRRTGRRSLRWTERLS